MEELNEKQCMVLSCIKLFMLQNGYSPSIRDLCKVCNLKSTASIFNYLRDLKALGYIDYVENKSRTIVFTEKGDNLWN